jgi:hypothetical protein
MTSVILAIPFLLVVGGGLAFYVYMSCMKCEVPGCWRTWGANWRTCDEHGTRLG